MMLGKGFYRFLGIVAAITGLVQSALWIILCLCGIICYYTNCGAPPKSTAFGRAFNLVYLDTEGIATSPCIDPVYFHVIMWFYLLLSVLWLLISGYLLFCCWKNSKKHKFSGPMWIIFTLFVCAIDFMFFIIFAVDFHRSLDANFSMTHESSPHRRSNSECKYRRMLDSDAPQGPLSPEERAMLRLSIANEKARLAEKMKLLKRLSETLSAFFAANQRNPLVLPPNFTTQATVPGVVVAPNANHPWGWSSPRERSNTDPRLCDLRVSRFKTRIGARMMIAPSAAMMTLAIRGYVLWLFNLFMALALWHFYIWKQRESFLRRFSI